MTRLELAGAVLMPLAIIVLLNVTGHRDTAEKVGVYYGIALAVAWVWGKAAAERAQAGIRPQLRCPHCGSTGQVHVSPVTRKKGISGGRATAGILTGGLSLWFIGLSRKEQAQACQCQSCGIRWDIA